MVNEMKKITTIILCVILATVFLTACAAEAGNFAFMGNDSYGRATSSAPGDYMMPVPAPDMMDDGGWDGDYYSYEAESLELSFSARSQTAGGGTDTSSVSIPEGQGITEKIIYSVFAEIETQKFDDTIDGVNAMLALYGAFIENSSISGVNLYSQFHGWNEHRYAHFTIRVPNDRLDAMTSNLSSLGNVIHENSNATNITTQFYDTQSRLNSLLVQEERLLDMLGKAEDVPDLIMIEERISDVRYQIEWLTTTLRGWQSQVDFSTVSLSIREVEQFTERVEINRTYWQQIGDGFMATIRSIGNFFMDVFMWLIVSAPVLLIIAVVLIIVFIVARKYIRKALKKIKETQNTPPAQ